MLFVSFIRWWYGPGWRDQVNLSRELMVRCADYFSFELTLRSLFKPFRQIDAERANKGPIGIVLRTLFDQLFSRVFGAILRVVLLCIGVIALILQAVVGLMRLIAWPFLIPAPVLSIMLALSGWIPWR